jgi:agmatine deiminase
MPAEWERHAATWLAWPHKRGDWPGKAEAIVWVYGEIVRHLCREERVRVLVDSRAEQRRAERVLRLAGADLRHVDFHLLKTDRSWTRDYLPLFVTGWNRRRTTAGTAPVDLAAVKWRFNGWARYRDHQQDEAAGRAVAARTGTQWWTPELETRGRLRRVVLEGGALDVDGQGTLVTSERCLLTGPYARNRSCDRASLENLFRDYLGAQRVFWLGDGIAGDDTAGHVDDFVRFVAPAAVVLCQQPRRRDPDHRPLEMARERLEGARDARGRKLEIVRLPMPSPLFFGAQRLPASYANFYIGNDTVLVPTFNDPTDRRALGTLAELFPGRRVVGVHAVDLVLGLGTVHCSTQQEPATRTTFRMKRGTNTD